MRKLFSREGPAAIARQLRRRFPFTTSVLGHGDYIPGTDVPADYAAARARGLAYVPGPLTVPAVVLGTAAYRRVSGSPDLGWAPLLEAGWWADEVPGDHGSMLGEPHVRVVAAKVTKALDGVGEPSV